MKLLRIVEVLVGEPARIATIDHELTSMQKIVGGFIEVVKLGRPNPDGVEIVANEEALINGLPVNRYVGNAYGTFDGWSYGTFDGWIRGPFFVTRSTRSGNFASLSEAAAERVVAMFNNPDRAHYWPKPWMPQ